MIWSCFTLYLGSYADQEENSIVFMDNASTHMSEEVANLIHSTGAYLIYSAPYSPDLSPIEYAFSVYKKYLKRNSSNFESNEWYELHRKAFRLVSRDHCIKFYRKCFIPFADEILTDQEIDEILERATL